MLLLQPTHRRRLAVGELDSPFFRLSVLLPFQGTILIAVNPLCKVADPPMKEYMNRNLNPEAPHPYAIAEVSFNSHASTCVFLVRVSLRFFRRPPLIVHQQLFLPSLLLYSCTVYFCCCCLLFVAFGE